ncbi:hypothetical protein MTO96_008167 [Rhipicephalus appendiculatus]
MWKDTTTQLYDETDYIPFYTQATNDITVPTASMLPPLMYPYGVDALNYGGLGTMIGHAIMGAFDAQGIQFLPGYVPQDMDDVMKEYTTRALCLRKSRKSVLTLSDQEERLSEVLDSENLADLVGTKMAYYALESLDSGPRDQNLAGLNISAQQLFFFNHCAKWCTQNNAVEEFYAEKRSRCIVPLMNMAEFSSAFGCAAEAPMNPRKKCSLW